MGAENRKVLKTGGCRNQAGAENIWLQKTGWCRKFTSRRKYIRIHQTITAISYSLTRTCKPIDKIYVEYNMNCILSLTQ